MHAIYKELKVEEFKSHQDLTVNFGEVTEITGDNAKGKSTIPESISWLLYGTDTLGSKLDPTPLTYESEQTLVQLLLSADGKDLLLGRGLKKGKTQYYINEVPSKSGEFNEIVDQLFDKDLFLSLFNPSYFFSMHWEKQRALIMQYVTTPANKEVLKNLPEEQGKHLGTLLKKHSLSDLEKIHKENKSKQDKKYIAAQSRTKTLKEQLDQLPKVTAPLESLKVELRQIAKQVRELEEHYDKAADSNREYTKVQSQIQAIQDQIDMSKERWPLLKNEVIEDTCRTCKRPLDEESVEAVQADKDNRIAEYKANHNELLEKRNVLKAKLAEMEYIDASETLEKIRSIDSEGTPLREAIQAYSQFERLQEQVNEAEKGEKSTLESLNDSIFVLDSIKAFKAKEAELQAEKVQALFTSLSVRLFKQNKGDGEFKPDFEIEMDGKPYSKLSLSEGIRAGLELRDVLSAQSETITPVFVDNAESITSFKQPVGQLIICRVVAGQELKIEGKDA
ncbi:AAA family ATPase [Metabacillus halosaccharovorans]|uniref:AAA family ATPase n=1 Tax=Metabacillus halosaccharovorans TaxID=930124 RepID=A0ABT3DCE8_9BACI|nr:AAA family ATPase [Metabacillus halosaccharovorans]MCV9884729.1 AAA family ATPase [Metabacillus halosaccharovorans]